MAALEDISVGSHVEGLYSIDEAVKVISVDKLGPNVLEVVYKAWDGSLFTRLLSRDDEESLKIVKKKSLFSFEGDGSLFRLASEAYRIRLAHLFDPYLSVYTSDIEPLPHQITAVYDEMLKRQPLRFILADDPGAGKTIMTGLLIKELMVRADVKRCLVVAPGSLVDQWQEELYQKFHLSFEILSSDRLKMAVTGNALAEIDLCIARLDTLARNEDVQDQLKLTDWDLIVCDEAHKMSATFFGGEIDYTKRFKLGRILSRQTRHFLLLTATPHNGKEMDFQLFLSLIDEDRFECSSKTEYQSVNVSDVMRRLVKEDLLKFDGTPLFPERRANTVNYELAPNEANLYGQVSEYVRMEFNRADALSDERKNAVGFALTSLQRRLASSPEAIYQSLKRRRERLNNRLEAEKSAREGLSQLHTLSQERAAPVLEDPDDYSAGEFEELEERISDQATAAKTIKELEAEIATLTRLEELAAQVRSSGEDRKWKELAEILSSDNPLAVGPNRERQKLIVFTEHRDTLKYLTEKIRALLGDDKAVVNIHGGLSREERRRVEELFKQDKESYILVATDAAGEGINLQRAHLMVNYDLPWNPNRLEQRFGRIHRIGQLEVCHLWNLVAAETREGMVFQLLFAKLERARADLGGKVFDVLGRITFGEKSLKDLLIEAIRYNNDSEVRDRLYKVVDKATDQSVIRELMVNKVLTEDAMNVKIVTATREVMERVEAHKMQPHFIEAFFLEAFRRFGGTIHKREKDRYEIKYVPYMLRNRDLTIKCGRPVLLSYERVCFEKKSRLFQGQIPADLVCPGRPVLDAMVDLTLEEGQEALKKGAVLIDDNDWGEKARILFYFESSIQDNVITKAGTQRIISRRVHYVEMDEDEVARNAGVAPYLNYRPAKNEEEEILIKGFIGENDLFRSDLEQKALNFASSELSKCHLDEVKDSKLRLIKKTVDQVNIRLRKAIRAWDYQANELKRREDEGKKYRISSQMAKKRADELEDRLAKRVGELKREESISALPPTLAGGALVLPIGLVHKLTGSAPPPDFGGEDREAAEAAAMAEVLTIERSLGYEPRDVSEDNLGYDIESTVPQENREGGISIAFYRS
jgi:SNF2 family DNA or RNA helicase